MPFTQKRKARLRDDLDLLLNDICSQWGFCQRVDTDDLIGSQGELTAAEFASRVLTTEGLHPEYDVEWRRRLEVAFRDRYGSSVSAQHFERGLD